MNRGTKHDLNGLWHIAPVDHELQRTGADPGLDHRHWATAPVPGHWSSNLDDPGGGPYLYRHRFRIPEFVAGADGADSDETKRFWLQLDGVMGAAEVWMDGHFLGDTVGYFAPHQFEITEPIRRAPEHVLALDVACPDGGGLRADDRSNISLTGSLQTGPFSTEQNPGGIWQPVSIRATGPIAIRHARLLCTKANEDEAVLRVRLILDSAVPTEAEISTEVTCRDRAPSETQKVHVLAAGENRLEWEITVENPDLWWPVSLGAQPLYDVNLTVAHEGVESDRRQWRTGLRRVEMKNFIWKINGQRLFMKSVAYGPSTPLLGDLSSDRLVGDVELTSRLGLDMMRVFAHISRPELYEAADRLGVLLWQDLPLIGGYSSKVRRPTKVMIQQAVDRLGHHPSVVAWGGHVLPNGDAIELPPTDSQEAQTAAGHFGRRLVRHITPTWNRGVLDPIVGRELRQADRSRPVITRSGSLPSPSDPGGSDAFLWFGWRIGLAADFADLVRRWPRLAAFPGGIGSQSVTVADWPMDAPDWPGSEKTSFNHYLPRRAYSDGIAWARATRAYQADLLETHIQILRRLKYRPSGGFCLFAFADNHPDGGFGLLDFDRQPKPAWERVFAACRPVAVLVEPLPTTAVPGQAVSTSIHVVNDLQTDLGEARVMAEIQVESDDGENQSVQRRGWTSTVKADSCAKVADLSFTVPETIGPLTISATLTTSHAGMPLTSTTTARTIVIPAAEAITS